MAIRMSIEKLANYVQRLGNWIDAVVRFTTCLR
jgi:hypothetical protein